MYNQARIIENICINKIIKVFLMKIHVDVDCEFLPGQFINIYIENKTLARPISVFDYENQIISIVYKVVGDGTELLSRKKTNESLNISYFLGNGISLDLFANKNVYLVGGGVGLPPIYCLAKRLNSANIVAGFNNKDEIFLVDELNSTGSLNICTMDGSLGFKGNVVEFLEGINDIDVIFSCGPIPMLKGISNYARSRGIDAYLSLEAKMACGIGACLSCVCKSKDIDEHSNVHNKRICIEGPIFHYEEIDI